MSFEAALVKRLREAGDVAALVGERISWVDRPQADELPAITLQTVSGVRAQTMARIEATQRPLVQIDVWASTFAAARALREAVIAALLPPAAAGDVRFQRGFVGEPRTSGEDTAAGFVHRHSMDFRLTFSNEV